MSTKFLSPGWRMPRNANQSKQSNYSMDFTASDKISLGSSVDLGINSSVSLWINMPNTPTIYIPLGEDSYLADYLMYVSSTLIYIVIGNVYKTYTHSFNTNQWYHIVIVRQGDSIEVFKDNTSLGTQTGFGTSVTTKIDTIGAKTNGNNTFIGLIDAVAFFDYALSSSQITTLYGTGSAIGNPMALPSPPIAYYPLGKSAWNGQYLAENNAIGDYVFDFLTSNSYIDTNFTLPASYTSYSYSIWYKQTSSFTGDNYLIGNWNQGSSAIADMRVSVRFNGGTKLRIITGNNTTGYQTPDLDVSSLLLDGNWHHIVVTVVSGEIKLYIDKNLEATHSNSNIVTGIAANRSYTLGFSGNTTYAGYLDNSQLSNFQIFNTALSATDVETLYNYGSPIRTLANIPQISNLKAWYKLDASEIYNSTSTEWSVDNNKYPSAYQSSLKFVASELDRIDIPHDTILNPSSNYTFSIWFNPTSSNSNSTLVGSSAISRGINMYYPPNNTKVVFYHKTSTANESFDIVFPDSPVDTWNNITVTWSASTGIIRAFINGKYVSQKENISDIVWSGTLKIGQYTSYAWYFDGQLSNLAMWDITLTDGFSGTPTTGDIAGGQVAEVYNNGQPQTSITGSPVGWWKLNNGGKFITDSSGNNFTGTNHSGDLQTGGAIEYAGFVSKLAGDSSGMSQANLVQSDLQTVAPYSKYALGFDGTNDYISCGNDSSLVPSSLTISLWFKTSGSASTAPRLLNKSYGGSPYDSYFIRINNGVLNFKIGVSSASVQIAGTTNVVDGNWHNVIGTYDGSQLKLYLDGNSEATPISETRAIVGNTSYNLTLGCELGAYGFSWPFTGSMSNVSLWNTSLTSAQVSEIYNEGLPGNLNSHSAYSNLVSWWQLGENSSFTSNWICADEKGTNNGESQNMGVDALTNGVGTTANGTSTGMSEGSLVGNAPYSTANALSNGMAVTARGTNVP